MLLLYRWLDLMILALVFIVLLTIMAAVGPWVAGVV
jgi:hypothetical protein